MALGAATFGTLLILAAIGAGLCGGCGAPQATQAPAVDPAADAAETSLHNAIQKGDAAALANLLDTNFVWIAANGKTFSREDTLKAVPKPALADETGADFTRFTYSDLLRTVTVSQGKMQDLRVWVKRPEGWRALVYQEVQLSDGLPAIPDASSNCDNPCKSIPFTPQDDVQKGVVSAYTSMESANTTHDFALWNDFVGYEFLTATSNTPEVVNKVTDLAQIKDSKIGAPAPTPLVSAQMYELPGIIVMRSKQQPAHGNPLEVTQVWIMRNDMWVTTLNFQTAVQP